MLLASNPVADALNSAEWIFPAAECFHIVGFGVAIGTVTFVDFSLLGAGLPRKSAPQLVRDTGPWTLTALVIVILAGLVLFLSDPVDYLENSSFRAKIVVMFLAIIFNYTVHRKVALSENSSPGLSKLVGAISLFLWLSVIFTGLFIAFVA